MARFATARRGDESSVRATARATPRAASSVVAKEPCEVHLLAVAHRTRLVSGANLLHSPVAGRAAACAWLQLEPFCCPPASLPLRPWAVAKESRNRLLSRSKQAPRPPSVHGIGNPPVAGRAVTWLQLELFRCHLLHHLYGRERLRVGGGDLPPG